MTKPWLQKIQQFVQLPLTKHLTAVLVFGLFLWFLALGDQGLYQLKKLSNIRDQLKAKEIELSENNEELRLDKMRFGKPENLEMVIRRELGYIRPGEVVYRAEDEQR